MKVKINIREFGFALVWSLVIFNGSVLGSHWDFLNQAKTLAGSVLSSLNGSKSTIEANQSIGKVFVFEDSLIKKYSDMVLNYKKELEFDSITHHIVKFPEASAFSTTFLENIAVNFETWMDLKECDRHHDNHEIVSQHILSVRKCNKEGDVCTSVFIYRPSFLAELDPEAQAHHVHYHTEATKTFDKVLTFISRNPQDQFIFAGLQSGGAIALLHSWMAVASNPHLCKNLVEYKGNLHQIKVFLYDTDCIISGTNQKNFPIPQWDVLRFYSNKTAGISSTKCRISAMSPIGLPYIYAGGLVDLDILGFNASTQSVNRAQFTKYFLPNQPSRTSSLYETEEVNDLLDGGIITGSNFDEECSVAPSEISMSVNEDPSQIQIQIQMGSTPPPAPFLQFLGRKDSGEESIYSEKYEKIGIKSLQESLRLSKFFHTHIKTIYRSQQEAHLRRDVYECAAAMTRYLSDVLLGNGTKIVATSLKRVVCSVETYNVRSKEALIICNLSDTKNPKPIPIFRFKAHVLNDTEKLLKTLNVTVIENGWEEITFIDQMPNSISDAAALLRPRGDSSITMMTTNYEILDDRSEVTKASSPVEQWNNCLSGLFAPSKHLNFINPLKENFSAASVIGTENNTQEPGKASITINLPYTNSEATCEFSLLNKSTDFYKFYRNSPSMFYSVFADTIRSSSFPSHCRGLLQPLFIENSGNAMSHANALKSFFVSHQNVKIDERDTIVGGYEIQSGVTNLPSANPYSVFTSEMCDKVSICLNTINQSKIMYDCTSPLTLWIGNQYCPDVCINAPDTSKLHLCSRVIKCGNGVFFGFRGCSMSTPFSSESTLENEFATVKSFGIFSPQAYYSAFQIKYAEKSVTNFSRPIRFAIFLNSSAVKSIPTEIPGTVGNNNPYFYNSNPMLEQRSRQLRPNPNVENMSQMNRHDNYSISSSDGDDEDEYKDVYRENKEISLSLEQVYSYNTDANEKFSEDPDFLLDNNLKEYNFVDPNPIPNPNILLSNSNNEILESEIVEITAELLESDNFENVSKSSLNVEGETLQENGKKVSPETTTSMNTKTPSPISSPTKESQVLTPEITEDLGSITPITTSEVTANVILPEAEDDDEEEYKQTAGDAFNTGITGTGTANKKKKKKNRK